MRQYLSEFFALFAYPDEAVAELMHAYDQLCACNDSAAIFRRQIASYEQSGQLDREQTVADACDAASAAGVLEDHATFLIYCLFSRHLRNLYVEKGLDLTVWHDSMRDLRIKAYECKAVKGHWGSFVSGWFTGFFNLTRFALGRLEFEITGFHGNYGPYCGHGVQLKDDTDLVVNVHIPSGSRMPYDQVLDAYRRAHHWFRSVQRNGKTVFACWSWLMYDKLPEIAGKSSNTYDFIMDYETVMSQEDPQFLDCWRLFDVSYTGDPGLLPQNGGLRRRYAQFLAQGGVAGVGYGIAVFDGQKILSRKKVK